MINQYFPQCHCFQLLQLIYYRRPLTQGLQTHWIITSVPLYIPFPIQILIFPCVSLPFSPKRGTPVWSSCYCGHFSIITKHFPPKMKIVLYKVILYPPFQCSSKNSLIAPVGTRSLQLLIPSLRMRSAGVESHTDPGPISTYYKKATENAEGYLRVCISSGF